MKFKVLVKTVIISALCLNTAAGAASYTDVPDNPWAVSSIDDAAKAGIMQGRDDGTFGLGDNIKRSEFAAMLVRLMIWDKSQSQTSVFSDVKNSEWYFGDVNTLAEHGVYSENEFRPNDNITRREINPKQYMDIWSTIVS